MKHLTLSLIAALVVAAPVHAAVYDTNSTVVSTNQNYWPFGDSGSTVYQQWFAQPALAGVNGVVSEISHFVGDDFGKTGTAAWNIDVYLSTTMVGSGELNADNPLANHGSNRTQVFSGWVTLDQPQLTIDIDDTFVYDGSANLLLEYQFNDFAGVSGSYSGPTWQSIDSNSQFQRVTQNSSEGNVAYNWGALRTELVTTPVPEPETYALLGMGLLTMVAARRRLR